MGRSDIALRPQHTDITNGHKRRRDDACQYAQRLVEAVKPRCVILFGSVAKGTDGERSDLDLVVIGGDLPENVFERIAKVNGLTRGLRTPADIFPYTETEFEHMLDNLHVTALDCMLEGKPLYGTDAFNRLRSKFEEFVARGLRRGKAAWYFDKKIPA